MKGKELQRVKVALLSELDVTLQKCCHQRLTDVVNDLQIHYASIKPDSSPDEVFSVFLQSGVLRTMTAAPIVRMRESPVHKWLVLRGEEFARLDLRINERPGSVLVEYRRIDAG